jgi:acyl-CoA synthetase (AMP-forming)/AMP-acid ligase II
MIIRGGVNISPAEIDNILAGHPEIAETAAIGVPDEIYGEEVVSYVVAMADKSLTREDILDHCKGKLPAFRTPKEIVFVDAIPKNQNGKIDRNALVELWRSR